MWRGTKRQNCFLSGESDSDDGTFPARWLPFHRLLREGPSQLSRANRPDGPIAEAPRRETLGSIRRAEQRR